MYRAAEKYFSADKTALDVLAEFISKGKGESQGIVLFPADNIGDGRALVEGIQSEVSMVYCCCGKSFFGAHCRVRGNGRFVGRQISWTWGAAIW